MEKRHYIVGLRPVLFEEKMNESFIYVFDWDNGKFVDDFTYFKKLFSGPYMDETEEISEYEFNKYVKKLRNERGLI